MPPGDDEFDRGAAAEPTLPGLAGDVSRADVERGWGGAPAAGIVTLVTAIADGVRGLLGRARDDADGS